MTELKWPVYQKSYIKEHLGQKRLLKTTSHPLQLQGVTNFDSKETEELDNKQAIGAKKEISIIPDPLSDPLSNDPLSNDPLSDNLGIPIKSPSFSRKTKISVPEPVDEWLLKRLAILATFTTSQKLTLAAGSNKHERANASSNLPEKVRDRLEQLDEIDDAPNLSNLTQAEYTKKIDEMGKSLYEAWNKEQRVKALKLCIQLSKLLIDTTIAQFYPSKFVLITDILIKFGNLVFQRLKDKSGIVQGQITIPLRADFTPDDVPDSAKETASNWFYKIASIRELLPRLYLQLAILKCNKFISIDQHREVLMQITGCARGIGDPLVGNYLRCFISRIGALVDPLFTSYLHPLLQDAIFIYPQLMKKSKRSDITLKEYLITHTPAYDWLFAKLVTTLSFHDIDQLLGQVSQISNKGVLLNGLLNSLPQQYIEEHVFDLLEQMMNCKEPIFSTFYLLKSLGLKMCTANNISSKDRKKLLKIVWTELSTLQGSVQEYIDCSVIWLEFVASDTNNTNTLEIVLDDIIKHLLPARTFETCYPILEKMLKILLKSQPKVIDLFTLSKFLPFLDLFQKESVKIDACKAVLLAYQTDVSDTTNSPIAISGLLYISKSLHNSVNALTLDDQKRDISELINNFISTVSYGNDLEEQLTFYVECRASFSNLDSILSYLVQCVCQLSITTLNLTKGSHNKKTSSFIRGCLAYCHITIPSLSCPFIRLNLYLLAGQCALTNLSLVQCDALLKEALRLVELVPGTEDGSDGRSYSTENKLIDWVSRFLSTLLYVPDNPAQPILHLYREMGNAIGFYKYWTTSGILQVKGLLLSYLINTIQPAYHYAIPHVDSNDKLYGQNKKFLLQVDTLINELMIDVISRIDAIENLAQEENNSTELRRLVFLIVHGLDITESNAYNVLKKVNQLCVQGSGNQVFDIVKAVQIDGIRGIQISPVLHKIRNEVLLSMPA